MDYGVRLGQVWFDWVRSGKVIYTLRKMFSIFL